MLDAAARAARKGEPRGQVGGVIAMGRGVEGRGSLAGAVGGET